MRYVTSTLHLETGACEKCGYLGWTFPQAIRRERRARGHKREGRQVLTPAMRAMDRRWI